MKATELRKQDLDYSEDVFYFFEGEGIHETEGTKHPIAELARFADDTAHLFIVQNLHRHTAAGDFLERMENDHYGNAQKRNHLYSLIILVWQGIAWGVGRIPLAERSLADSTAGIMGLRLANGVPHIMRTRGPSPQEFLGNCYAPPAGFRPQDVVAAFPLNTRRVVAVEPSYPVTSAPVVAGAFIRVPNAQEPQK